MKLLLLLLALVGPVVAFAPSNGIQTTSLARNVNTPLFAAPKNELPSTASPILAGLATGLIPTLALAGEEIEMAELPPPWVPAIFAVLLLVGVGVLTGSLGNVIDEEASLGLQSGARARKEIERSRSSYFKKK